jgi:hypothetical protein
VKIKRVAGQKFVLGPGPYLIVARTAEKAKDFIAAHKLENARFVRDFRTVMMYDYGARVVFVGDYQQRRDWPELQRVLGIRDLLRTALVAP